MLSTDNFEFLADFHPKKDLRFVSEICGYSLFGLAPGQLSVNDILTNKLEKSLKQPLTVRVKSIDQNGKVNRVFIDVYY